MVKKVSLRTEKFGVGIPGCFVKSEICPSLGLASELSRAFFLVNPCRYSIERRTRVFEFHGAWSLLEFPMFVSVYICLSFR